MQDALESGNLEEARRLYAALIADEPRWRDALRSVATLPDYERLSMLLDE